MLSLSPPKTTRRRLEYQLKYVCRQKWVRAGLRRITARHRVTDCSLMPRLCRMYRYSGAGCDSYLAAAGLETKPDSRAGSIRPDTDPSLMAFPGLSGTELSASSRKAHQLASTPLDGRMSCPETCSGGIGYCSFLTQEVWEDALIGSVYSEKNSDTTISY